jgi:hypothetical protein
MKTTTDTTYDSNNLTDNTDAQKFDTQTLLENLALDWLMRLPDGKLQNGFVPDSLEIESLRESLKHLTNDEEFINEFVNNISSKHSGNSSTI